MNERSFKALPLLCILRGVTAPQLDPVLSCIHRAGIVAVEITMNTQGAPELIAQASQRFGTVLWVGAGTVLSAPDARVAVAHGARFIVAPNTNREVAEYCQHQSLPYFPGALTPNEIAYAGQCGATMVKVFPASLFGPPYIKEVRGPLNHIPLMAVGGVTPENVGAYFEAGVSAVAIGGSTFKREWMESGAWEQISTALSQYVDAYHQWTK